MFLRNVLGLWLSICSSRTNNGKQNKRQRRRDVLERACAFEGLEGRTLLSFSVADFSLVNADTDTAIMQLKSGTVVDLATLPTRNLTIRANKDGEVGSVRFALDGNANYRTDNSYPFALTEAVNGDYPAAWAPGSSA